MTREIKFRAWTNHNGWSDGMMVTQTLEKEESGYLCMNCQKVVYMSDRYKEQNGEVVEVSQWEECANTIIMQFTGLLDKNGTEIYEGDIIKMGNNQECWFAPRVVEFINGCWVGGACRIYTNQDRHFYEGDSNQNNWEIIGNIYQNLELINSKTN